MANEGGSKDSHEAIVEMLKGFGLFKRPGKQLVQRTCWTQSIFLEDNMYVSDANHQKKYFFPPHFIL